MVRRWSYINRVNASLITNNRYNIKPVINALNLLTFKATTYYWDELFFSNITLIKRRSYSRRKHINNFFLYQILLSKWSADYSFFRNYSKSIFNINLHKYNYLMQNIFVATSLDISNFLGLENFKITSLNQNLINFCFKTSKSMMLFLFKYKGPYLYATFNKPLNPQVVLKDSSLKEEVFYPYIGNSVFLYKRLNTASHPLYLLNNVLFNVYTLKAVSYYQLMILMISLLIVLFLRKLQVTSGASRNTLKLVSKWNLKKRFNSLTWTKKSISGRGSNGRVILKSKSSLLIKLRLPKINYFFRSKELSIISTFYLIPFQNKLVALCFLSSGSVTYLQSTTFFKNFSIISTTTNPLKSFRRTYFTPLISTILRIKVFSKVSLLELYPGSGVQYARSSGVSGRIIKSNFFNHTALITLPSGVRKSFSLYSIASIGPVSLKIKRLVKNTKSGFWRTFGLKARTRGVAMNPVDHPHGGRTKAIKNPRTPWGKPTKLK